MRYDVMFVGGSFPMPMGGGSVNYVYRLLSEFKGISYFVYTSSYGKKKNIEFDNIFGHKVIRSKYCHHVLGSYRKSYTTNILSIIVSVLQIVYYILKYKPKLVYFTEISFVVYSYKISRLFYGLKVGLFTYSEEILQIKDRPIYRSLLQHVLRDSDVIITVCDYTHNMLNEIYNVDDKIHKIIPSVPYVDKNVEKEKKGKDSPIVFLTIGRLIERKGHIDVIDALCRLYKDYPNIKYVIIGEGEYENSILQHIKMNRAESFVEMKGKVSDTELIEAYSKADIFVMHHKQLSNGDTEGCPTVFLEASLHKLPVVGGEAGGVSDAILDGKTGFICHKNTDELYIRLKQLLENESLRKELGENGFNYSIVFSAYNQSNKFLNITKNLLLQH